MLSIFILQPIHGSEQSSWSESYMLLFSVSTAINVIQWLEICCIFLFHAWMCTKKHHGNNQSSLATHRVANYPTVKPTVFDFICIFHDLNCQFIWERQHLQFHPSAHFTGAFVWAELSLRIFRCNKTTQEMLIINLSDIPSRRMSFICFLTLTLWQVVKMQRCQAAH